MPSHTHAGKPHKPALRALIGSCFVAAISACFAMTGHAAEFDWSASVEPEWRYFFSEPSSPAQEGWNVSLSGEVEFEWIWDNGDQNIVVTPFARWDRFDKERSHLDLREARYERIFDFAEVRVGFDKVFWGVTEAAHLVDIINQTDAVENVDGEEKLGQPMINVAVPTGLGTFDFFYMPYFRERTAEGRYGRPRFDIPIDLDQAVYEDSDEEWHADFAVRWSHYFGNFDIGLAYFNGTGRAPLFLPGLDAQGRPILRPFYVQIEQASVDVQATFGPWLYKLEGLIRDEFGDQYVQAAGGIEYTFYGIYGSAADLGVVAEYIYDERGKSALNPLDNEAFAGLRLALNDVQSTALLAGVLVDLEHSGWSVRIEAERRLGDDFLLSIEAQFIQDVPVIDPFFSISDDDFLQVRLTRYF